MADTATAEAKPADPRLAFTPVGLLCFADGLIKPRPRAENGAPSWNCILLFNDEALASKNYQMMRAAVLAAIKEKFGEGKAADPNFIKALRLPFRPAAEKNYAGFDQGKIYISPWSDGDQKRPGIIDNFGADVEPTTIFSGMLARAEVRAFAYDTSGNKGVSFGLNSLQIVNAAMPRLDGRRSAAEAFKTADNSELVALGIDTQRPAGADSLSDSIPF